MTTERDDLVETLRERREFLRTTLEGLSDEQAGRRSTVSELCLGGIVKHVSDTEDAWAAFITGGAPAMDAKSAAQGDWQARFRMESGDTVASVLARYDEVAARVDALDPQPARSGRVAPAARGAVVPGREELDRPARRAPPHRRDGPALRPRRHPAGVHRRRQDHGLSPGGWRRECRGRDGALCEGVDT